MTPERIQSVKNLGIVDTFISTKFHSEFQMKKNAKKLV